MAVGRMIFSGARILALTVFAGLACEASAVTVAWNPNPETNIAGYRLYYGPSSSTPTKMEVGNTTQAQISNLTPGTEYSFYVTAYNTSGLESDPSSILKYTAQP